MTESSEHRLKRLNMRSWRRGTKEMDMILGPFADAELKALIPKELDAYESFLTENDQDLYRWVSGQAQTPQNHAQIVDRIRAHHNIGG